MIEVTEENIGDADYPVTVLREGNTRKALISILDKDIRIQRGQLWIDDVLWLGTWSIIGTTAFITLQS